MFFLSTVMYAFLNYKEPILSLPCLSKRKKLFAWYKLFALGRPLSKFPCLENLFILWVLIFCMDSLFMFPLCGYACQKYMPRRRTGEEMNFTYVECLLYTFHHLAYKVHVYNPIWIHLVSCNLFWFMLSYLSFYVDS